MGMRGINVAPLRMWRQFPGGVDESAVWVSGAAQVPATHIAQRVPAMSHRGPRWPQGAFFLWPHYCPHRRPEKALVDGPKYGLDLAVLHHQLTQKMVLVSTNCSQAIFPE